MKITRENYTVVPENEQKLLLALLDDIDNFPAPLELEIHWQEWHTEYSCEWTDPCPDYWHTYSLRWEGNDETINDGFTIDELNNNMCTLYCGFEQLNELIDK